MNTRSLSSVVGILVLLALLAGGWRWTGREKRPSPPPQSVTDLVSVASPGPTSSDLPAGPLPSIGQADAARKHQAPPPTALFQRSSQTQLPARLLFASAWEREAQPVFAAFNDWANRWRNTAPGARAAFLAEGVARARNRQAAMTDLIRRDPQQAIASAVPMTVRAELPPEVLVLLEERVSGTGELALNAVTPAPGVPVAEPVFRTASVNGKTYRAYVYGRREAQATKPSIALLGVALDGAFAVSESPLRVLEPGETPAPGVPVRAAEPLPGQHAGSGAAAIETAGVIVQLCCARHIAAYETQLIRAEDAAGPYEVPSLGDSGPGTANISGRPPISWSQGTKKVLFIRVDFSDKTGAPVVPFGGPVISDNFAVNMINDPNQVGDSFAQGSFQKTTLSVAPTGGGDSPDVTPVFRLPQTAVYYAVGDGNGPFDQQLHDDARTAATTAGINLANYDRIGVIFSNLGSGASNANPIAGSQVNYGGRANVQGKNFWINGFFNFGTVVHELGHTYGLLHANLWVVTDGNPTSPAGTSLEYGDPFSPMGTSPIDITNHLSHWEKSLLQWIPDTGVTTASTSGTYRIHRFNHPNANLANPLALKIVRNATEDYWIGFSPEVNGSPALLNGAYVMWGYNAVRESNLLDLATPGSNATDAPLAIGATFNDTAAGLTIQPLAKGGTSPNEWLDVQITLTPRIQWSAASYSVDEKLGTATLTVTRSNGTSGAVTVNYATADGTALAGTHYTAQSGQVSWASGDGTPKTITIPIATSPVFTGLKSFTVTLSGITGGGVITGNATTTVNIASAGTADPLFAHDYINSAVKQVVAQPDGKLLFAGWFSTIYDTSFTAYPRGGVARLHSNGTIDQTFGNGAGADAVPVNALALQPDGKVLIGGSFANVHGTPRVRVARLNTDGSLDTTFNPGTGPDGEVFALAVQPDGKILLGGNFTSVAGQTRGGIARLNADGALDATFVGPVLNGFPNASIESIALQPNGQPIIAGSFYLVPSPWRSGVARLTTTGALDVTFNPGFGAHIEDDTGFLQTVQKVAVQLDGKILVGGYFTGFNGATRERLARLNANGTLDAGFVPLIDPSVPVNTAPYPTVRAMLVQADGRIAIGGTFSQVNGSALSNFARLNAGGTLDTTFEVGSGSSSGVNDFVMPADGRIVLATDWGTIQGTIERALARLFTGVPGLPGTVQFSAPAVLGSEGNTATITATRTGGSYGEISVNYATIPGTATAADFTGTAATLTWVNGDATSRTINVPLTSDIVAEPDESFTLNLGIPLGGTMLGAPGFTTTTVTTAFQAWRRAHFSAAELADSAFSGDHADPNRNGLVNLLDFAFGIDPKLPGLTNTPRVGKVNISGADYLTLSIHRVPTAKDLTYTPQSGAPLGTWNGAPVQVGSPVTNPDGTETVTYRDSMPITPAVPQRFLRLEVTRQP